MAKAFDKSINICSPQPVFSLFSAGRMDVRTKGSEIGSRERESRPSKTPSTPVNGSKTHTQSCLLMLCWPAGLFSRLASNQVERPTLSLCGGRRLASVFPVDKSTPLSVSIAVVGVDVDKWSWTNDDGRSVANSNVRRVWTSRLCALVVSTLITIDRRLVANQNCRPHCPFWADWIISRLCCVFSFQSKCRSRTGASFDTATWKEKGDVCAVYSVQ